ncbi:MAG: CHAT domain-containing protein [Oscillatoriaceae cyanobacterium Prado104]|jgi:tetratricopeptide (TPR) repeat protein|nr:CHAT domain-containing protein [Oscillatoriaceae cyanobacterium Prado104]
MNEQRGDTDVNMLRALLEHSGDSGANLVLSADPKSIDSELMQTLYLKVPELTRESLAKASKFLQKAIAPLEVARSNSKLPATPTAYLIFLAEVLRAAASNPDPQRLYPVLRSNLDKLDQNFAQLLRRWATALLPMADRAQAREIAAQIGNLSNAIGRFPLGSRANNLEIEIAGYEAVARVFTRREFPEQWATLQNNLGNAYSDRVKGDRAQNLEQAIACFENALQVRTLAQYPEQWATLQNNLGSAYSDRLRGDPANNLEKAIECYQKALQVRTREAFGGDWASIQNNLGRAYSRRLAGDRAQNLEQAIACYRNALQVYNRKSFPRGWATTQNNLANAFCDRIRGNRAENLEYAVNCYQRALQIRTRETFPLQWATTHSNLGRVFIDRVKGDRAQNLEQAIECYHNALQVYSQIRFPERWSSIQTYLGRAYNLRVKGDRADNLEMAVSCYQNALLFCNRQKYPERWAMLCTYLGRALSEHLKGERNRNLRSAIACYQNALQVYTKTSAPERWAMLLADLGRAFCELTDVEDSSHLQNAIACYHSAGQVYTREAHPHRWAQNLFDLGQAHRAQGDVLRAYNVFAAAVETVEFLRGEPAVDELSPGDRPGSAKLNLARTWTELYKSLVQVCLELGTAQPAYHAKALEYAERYKARSLVEMLAKCHLTPKAEIPAAVQAELEGLQLEIAVEQQQQEQRIPETRKVAIAPGDESQDLSTSFLPHSDFAHLNQLWQQLDGLIAAEVNAVDPFYSLVRKVEPLEYKQIQELLPDENSAAIFWASLGEVLVAFAVVPGAEYPAVHICSPENALALEGWATEYFSAYSGQKGRWIDRLPARLNRLAALLEIDRVVALIPEKCDRLILVPHRFLHALPLHALPLGVTEAVDEVGGSVRLPWGDRTGADFDAAGTSDFSQGWSFGEVPVPEGYLSDRFGAGIRYAPNSQLLRLKQAARNATVGRYRPRLQQLLAVCASIRDSLYNHIEVTNICQYFAVSEVIAHKLATKETVCRVIVASNSVAPLQQKKCAHFAGASLLNLAHPLKSAVFLKNESLSLLEIFNLDFRQFFLVTLSACETAPGGVSNPGDFVGLPAGLLYGGASSVVSSLWKVGDVSTLLLMGKFYENLERFPKLQVGDVAIALHDAQKWLRELTGEELEVLLADFQPQISQTFDLLSQSYRLIAEASLQQIRNRKPHPFANPYYWAGFTAAGI